MQCRIENLNEKKGTFTLQFNLRIIIILVITINLFFMYSDYCNYFFEFLKRH